jgi:ATP-dependent DNA ligase
MPPIRPMLAKAIDGFDALPAGDMLFEPKWDGFRCIVFRDGDEIELGSRNERPLTRYFPELSPVLAAALPDRCVVDGEVVLAGDHGLDFDNLQQRIHPAASRVKMLSEKTPASFVAFDVLAVGDDVVTERPFAERRRLLEEIVTPTPGGVPPSALVTQITADRAQAEDWFTRFEGAGLDGVVAKPTSVTYRPDERVMFKLKHRRDAECVVAGYRVHKSGDGLGSLLLGVYDAEGTLHHIGVATGFTAAMRRTLREEVAPYEENALENHPWREWADAMAHATGRMPGGPSRWNATKDLSWEPLRPELVCEVTFQHLQNGRFRHPAKFLRWRPDRDPRSCTYDQLDVAVPYELREVLGHA